MARLGIITSIAMIAFAGNSLLCRIALSTSGIDAASFTTIRVVSGAMTLFILAFMARRTRSVGGNWLSAIALFDMPQVFLSPISVCLQQRARCYYLVLSNAR